MLAPRFGLEQEADVPALRQQTPQPTEEKEQLSCSARHLVPDSEDGWMLLWPGQVALRPLGQYYHRKNGQRSGAPAGAPVAGRGGKAQVLRQPPSHAGRERRQG